MPTAKQKAQIARLISFGCLPADAELVVQRAAQVGKGGLTQEALDAFGEPTLTDQMHSREWWLYSGAVSDEYKRLLEAGAVNAKVG